MPNLMWGNGVRVFTVDDGWGWIFTAVEHWNGPSVSAGMSASAATASPPCSRSPWGLRGCMPRPPPVRRGGWPCGWITAPSICRTTSPTRSSSGASSRPTPSSPSPRPTASPTVQSHAEGTDTSMVALPQHRGAAGRRPRLRRTLQCPVDRRKERLPEPRSSSPGVARRDLNQARRVRQTCVQGTFLGASTVIQSVALPPRALVVVGLKKMTRYLLCPNRRYCWGSEESSIPQEGLTNGHRFVWQAPSDQ